jgi:hypothetical protein
MSETPEENMKEAKRRAEWLDKHKAPKEWLILTEAEVFLIRAELSAIENELYEAKKDLEFRRELFKVQESQLNDIRIERDRLIEAANIDKEIWQKELARTRKELLVCSGKLDQAAKELIDLRALELNHDGACARTKKENKDLGTAAKKAENDISELFYIADRALDLAEIDIENDKFGLVTELRSDLKKLKKSRK